jgi:hypothetical protein
MVSGEDRLIRFHHALHDDVYRNVSLCRKFGVSWLDLMNLSLAQLQTHLGLLQMADHLPKILNDIGEDSESRDGVCPACDGTGYVVVDSIRYQCVVCDGVGKVRVAGDAHARRQLFEIIGLTGPRRHCGLASWVGWRLRHEVIRVDSAEQHHIIQVALKRPVRVRVAGFAGGDLGDSGLRDGMDPSLEFGAFNAASISSGSVIRLNCPVDGSRKKKC